jgi:hypothetical protein
MESLQPYRAKPSAQVISSRLWFEQVWLRFAAVLLAAAVQALQVL